MKSLREFIEVYKDESAHWRWRLTFKDGSVLCESSQGYLRRVDAINALCQTARQFLVICTDLVQSLGDIISSDEEEEEEQWGEWSPDLD